MKDAETEKLKSIVRGYACNLQAEREHEGNEDFDYVRNACENRTLQWGRSISEHPKIPKEFFDAEIEFPVYLLYDINRELSFSGTENFPVLEKHGLPRNFDLQELVRNFEPGFGRMGCLTGYELSEIISARIIGKRVHLDVVVKRKCGR